MLENLITRAGNCTAWPFTVLYVYCTVSCCLWHMQMNKGWMRYAEESSSYCKKVAAASSSLLSVHLYVRLNACKILISLWLHETGCRGGILNWLLMTLFKMYVIHVVILLCITLSLIYMETEEICCFSVTFVIRFVDMIIMILIWFKRSYSWGRCVITKDHSLNTSHCHLFKTVQTHSCETWMGVYLH